MRTAAIVGGVAFTYLVMVAAGTSSVPAGTKVLGVDLGSLSATEARQRLTAEWERQASQTVTVRAGDAATEISRGVVRLDVDATVAGAIPNRWLPWDLPRAWAGGGELAAVGHTDPELLRPALDQLEAASEGTREEPQVRFDGTAPIVIAGHPGAAIDRGQAANAVRAAVLNGESEVAVSSSPVDPVIPDSAAAEVVAGPAVAAVSAPAEFEVGDQTLTASPEDIAAVLSYRAKDGELVPEVDGTMLLDRIGSQLPGLHPAKDAVYEEVDGSPVMTPSQDGKRIAPEQIGRALIDMLAAPAGERKARVDLTELKPDYSSAQVPDVNTPDMLASFTQTFEPAEYRTINIGGASKKIDGKVLQPGETFSMNDTVGERTEENGFTKGLVVGEGSQLVPSMGGGVSTATTAMWTAAFFAGLERVEQEAHTLYIPRYTPGLEATVVWDRLDLKFRNNTDHPLLIRSTMTDSSINVSIYGTKKYDRVESKIHDSRFQGGTETCRSGGGGPFDVSVDRVLVKDGAPVETQKFTTHYAASLGVKCDSQTQ